ncbi:T9SS type A sorting domain-containing protein [Wenyingzhuangia sp. IMCC45574]
MRKIVCLLLFVTTITIAQEKVSVRVNVNVKHIVGGVSEFDRSKFITIHSNQMENEWDGENFTSDLRADFLEGYDVYLGRDTGGITWNLNYMEEDPTRPGYADPNRIVVKGRNSRNNYASKSHLHKYEARKNHVVGAQLHPFWTGESQIATRGTGWKLASPTATGEYMGRYFNEFHGDNGQPLPKWVEVINEPAYEALGGKKNYTNSLQEIADFHVEVADAIKAQNPNLKVGGYTVAFPDFETGDFQRWINRDKLFIDVAGEKMDFWAWHLYDFPAIGGRVDLRSGSNLEATFDMHDQYSMLQLGHTKQYVISEYGAQTHDYNNQPWGPYRDWLFLRAQNSMMMSFMERPQDIAIAIPFTIVKAEWGFNHDKNLPYGARLMRKTNEPASYTGEWVYTERVKFYQLWKNVKGMRVDSYASDLDIQLDAYIDGNKGYVILNNLEFVDKEIELDVFDHIGVKVNAIQQKHLKLSGDVPVLEDKSIATNTTSLTLGAGATMILEYEFENNITLNETSNEVKYYADSYLKSIVANEKNQFNINNVTKPSDYGEGVLRVSIGRDHGSVIIPKVWLNGVELVVPEDYRGYNQADKGRFFGTLEIPVSYGLLNTDNVVSVAYPDNGGHVSSVLLQVFNFSANIREVDLANLPANNYQIKAVGTTCPGESNGKIEVKTRVGVAYKAEITGNGVDSAYDFNTTLTVADLSAGDYTVSIAPKDLLENKTEFVVKITEATPVSFTSVVDKVQKKVILELTGSDNYRVSLNGVEKRIFTNKAVLDLEAGYNKIEVKTDKACQKEFVSNVFLEEKFETKFLAAEKTLFVAVDEEHINATVKIYNMLGVQVKAFNLSKTESVLPVGSLSKGLYLITLSDEESYLGTKKVSFF